MLELIILTLAIVASIGPTNIFAIKEGVIHGAKNTFFIIFGGIVVDLFYANLAGIGLSALGENVYFKLSLLFIGSLIFINIGYKGLKRIIKREKIKELFVQKKTHPFLTGILMTLPNPFTIIFWATALAGLTIGYKPIILFIIVLSVGGIWALIEAGIIHFTRKFINKTVLAYIEAITSIIILIFAVKFLWQFVTIINNFI